MLTTVHLLFGGAIGKYLTNLWLIAILAITSHYLLDFIPHYSLNPPKNFKKEGLKGCNKKDLILKGIEPILGIILITFLIISDKQNSIKILLGAFFGLLPDFLCFIAWEKQWNWTRYFLPRTRTKFYHKWQTAKGIWIQVIFFLIGLTLFFSKELLGLI